MTEGQALAVRQIEKIAQASNGSIEILSVQENATVEIEISLYCGNIKRETEGIPLYDRERFIIDIYSDFPFRIPSVATRHMRFAGYPHVQWLRHLCLYQAPQTEWNPSDGMHGLMDRLCYWLEKAAAGQLDPDDAPLHPPVAYASGNSPLIIPKKNTPIVNGYPWMGKGVLKYLPNNRVDIIDWYPLEGNHNYKSAAAILLHKNLPFEYPATIKGLVNELEKCGISKESLFSLLQFSVWDNEENDPLYVIVGTPMRGMRSGTIKQHLAVWCIRPIFAQGFRLCLNKYLGDDRLRAIGQECEKIMNEWAETAQIEWCRVREDRPEVVIRRDHESNLSWFKDKKVSLWGCGALGCQIAESLIRAGAKSLFLHDNGCVTPGILVRQLFEDSDMGINKSIALSSKLQKIYPDTTSITPLYQNLLDNPLGLEIWDEDVDIIIDTTANVSIAQKLELRRNNNKLLPVLVSMCIGHKAEKGMVVISKPDHSGGPFDVLRSTKYELCNRGHIDYLEEFWPSERRKPFQPEPGCSEATYVGSLSDIAVLAGTMLNYVAESLTDSKASAYSYLVSQPHLLKANNLRFRWQPDIVLHDPHKNYEIRLTNSSWKSIRGWCSKSKRENNKSTETGGLLFGEEDNLLKIIWVTEVLGPPPDSIQTDKQFICGKEGVLEAHLEKRKRTKNSVSYVGMWHTHPDGMSVPSDVDIAGMFQLLKGEEEISKTCLLMIIGNINSNSEIGCFYFESDDFDTKIFIRQCELKNISCRKEERYIGLALSGGGSRAIAFHLGCLRALYDRGLLNQVKVISTVSGGSVVGAMYVYSADTFEDFDKYVVAVLKSGLHLGILQEFLLNGGLPRALGTLLFSGIPALLAKGANAVLKTSFKPPFRRWSTRTTSFEHLLSQKLFGKLTLCDKRRNGIEIVINACELRTGAAFRFGSKESGCWRYGKLSDNGYPVSKAVAASAAYPALLPAIDESYEFVNKQGDKKKHRVILTDGGVFDNLGLTCMEPGRSTDYSYNVYNPDYIICCNAGHGIFKDNTIPYFWPSRMKRSFESVFRKVHDASVERLHCYLKSGQIQGFILPYLGQQDHYLPYIPPDLVMREDVSNYPTDFAPMSEKWIRLISDRGEQLTRILLDRYLYDI